MGASESPVESYNSNTILFFAYLNFSSVSVPKVLKVDAWWCSIFTFNEKLQNIFEIALKKYGVTEEKSLAEKKYFKIKNS